MTRIQATFRVVLAAGFLGSLVLPLVDALFGLDPFPPLAEKRALAALPPAPDGLEQLAEFPKRFTAHFDDHLGFRVAMVRLNSLIQTRLFARTDSPSVIIGTGGWLFYTGKSATHPQDGAPIDDLEGRLVIGPAKLQAMRARTIERRRFLASEGIRYLLVIVPNKSTIYPEYLPSSVVPAPRNTVDQFLDALPPELAESVLDLRPALLEAKRRGPTLYLKTDSHWNALGAFWGDRSIAERLRGWFPPVRPLEHAEMSVAEKPFGGGDLAGMIGVDGFAPDVRPELVPRNGPSVAETVHPAFQGDPRATVTTTSTDGRLPRALVFHDSFGEAIRPFLAAHLSQATFAWGRWDPYRPEHRAAVLQARPQVVIDLVVQRYLDWL